MFDAVLHHVGVYLFHTDVNLCLCEDECQTDAVSCHADVVTRLCTCLMRSLLHTGDCLCHSGIKITHTVV